MLRERESFKRNAGYIDQVKGQTGSFSSQITHQVLLAVMDRWGIQHPVSILGDTHTHLLKSTGIVQFPISKLCVLAENTVKCAAKTNWGLSLILYYIFRAYGADMLCLAPTVVPVQICQGGSPSSSYVYINTKYKNVPLFTSHLGLVQQRATHLMGPFG